MKRILATLLLASAALLQANAQLEFRSDGTFKIMQLTDLHLSARQEEEAEKVFDRIASLAESEAPDLIVITGDMVFGKPAGGMLETLRARLDSLYIPWAVVYGNHDAEQDLSRQEMSAIYTSGERCLNTLDPYGCLADIELAVCRRGEPQWYLYLMDSHDYYPDRKAGTYACFSGEQVEWLGGRCSERTDRKGRVKPALAFFHIPLQEYIDAWSVMDSPRLGQQASGVGAGIRGEAVACGAVNTGMFARMLETGSVCGVFCGHDHDNDFLACYKGIALAYGRYSGCDTVYNHLPAGARIIVIKAGSRKFDTWVREGGGRVIWKLGTDGTSVNRASTKSQSGLYGR